jgi:hypothetical protein
VDGDLLTDPARLPPETQPTDVAIPGTAVTSGANAGANARITAILGIRMVVETIVEGIGRYSNRRIVHAPPVSLLDTFLGSAEAAPTSLPSLAVTAAVGDDRERFASR